MATNREMLKEAIADAKAVKETAIANAKVALEEAFTPQLKSMFAAKLQEMASDDEINEIEGFGDFDTKDNAGFSKMGEKALDEMGDEKMMEVDLEELLRELELEEDDTLNEAEEEEEPEESEESEESDEEGEPLDLEDLTDEDLKSMIEDVIADMIKSGELEAGHEGEKGEESEEYEEAEVDLAELLREIEEMEEMDYMEETETVNEGGMASIIVDLFGNDGLVSFKAGLPVVLGVLGTAAAIVGRAYSKFKKEEYNKSNPIESAKSAAKDVNFIKSEEGKAAAAELAKSKPVQETELYEAYSTIKILKSELNEINLLNAKLLYTNKIFKAKNLNESQKVKVLTSFDRAKNVGEVKMVFETLNEGIKVSKNIIKENLGRASKGTMTPNVNKPIVESNEAFLRMQKLAGII
jgi:hypothetical protein